MWDNCVTHEFVQFMYKTENYVVIRKPNLTYQKTNDIVKKTLGEDVNQINLLKYKIEEKFKFIKFILCCLAKFTTKQVIL